MVDETGKGFRTGTASAAHLSSAFIDLASAATPGPCQAENSA
jgi:hypothetical protein